MWDTVQKVRSSNFFNPPIFEMPWSVCFKVSMSILSWHNYIILF